MTQRPAAAASSDRPVADGRRLQAKRIEHLVPTHEGSLGHLVLTYLRDLEVRGLSRHTVRGRSAQLRHFLVWCEGRTVRRPDDLDREVLDAYRLWVAGCETRDGKLLSPATRHDRVATVLRFVRWAHRTGRLPVDPSAGV